MLVQQAITTNFVCSTPEEAIREAGRLLTQHGVAKEEYVEAMIASFHEFGAYFVITDAVAMPHARPEFGAINTGLSVVVLNNDVVFGNEDFDPVRVVVGLAAKDSDSHIEAITYLATLFEDEAALEELKAATTPQQVLKIFKK